MTEIGATVTAIRCAIVEPQPIFLRGEIDELDKADDVEVVGTARTGKEGIAMIRDFAPDVVVVSYQLPDIDGLKVLAEQTDMYQTAFIVLTSENTEDIVYNCMVAGARGCMMKFGVHDLADSVRRANRGQVVMCIDSLKTLVASVVERVDDDNTKGRAKTAILTPRETEVLTMIGQGLNQSQIATRLGLSKTTVKSHCRNSYAKLGVNKHAHAVAEALNRGLIHLNGDRRG